MADLDGPTRLADAEKGQAVAAPERHSLRLPQNFTDTLNAFTRSHQVTLNTLIQGSWSLLLSKMTGRTDIVFGATVAGRPPEIPGVESMVGLFINTVPVRVRLDLASSAAATLTRLQDEQSRLMQHQYMSLARLQRLAGFDELFDTVVVFENYPVESGSSSALDDSLAVERVAVSDATHYPVSLMIVPGSSLELRFDYRPDLFSGETVEALGARLVRVLEGLVRDPDAPIGTIDVLDPAERDRLLVGWNDTGRDVSAAVVPGLFEARVAVMPDAVAVVSGGEVLSYREVNARADRLAECLAGLGVGPERAVAVWMERSCELVVALLAVLKTGGFYVPLHEGFPAERLRFVVGDCAAPVVVTDRPGQAAQFAGTATVVDVRNLPAPAAVQSGAAVRHPVCADGLAYVMYTSGSTGTPKGVGVSHRNVVELVTDRAWQDGGHRRVLMHAPHAFDVSNYELWVPLLLGGQVVIAPDGHIDATALRRLITEHDISAVHVTAGLFRVIADEDPACFTGVTHVLTGGDIVSPSAVHKVLTANPDLHVTALYGPTETTLCATRHTLTPTPTPPATIPIGHPLDNTQTYILDTALQPVPAGVTGELYIAGTGLARGYLNRPDLTADRFTANPYGPPGSRMYRTGDLARWRTDGVLEFIGRADAQVKIRGFRIEPGEIETVLASCAEVAQAAVIVREDRPGDKRLVGYVVPVDAAAGVDVDVLRKALAEQLPDYMVPSAFVVLEALPLTPNGKLDRRALPAPDFAALSTRRAPRDERERVLCELFAGVLGLPEVGIEDSFFDLGGDSIVSIQLVARARAAGLVITPRDVFERKTVRALAVVAGDADTQAVPVAGEAIGRMPLTPVMCQLLERGGSVDRFSQGVLVQVPPGLEVAHLVTATATVLDHHDMLRSRLHTTPGDESKAGGAGGWELEVLPPGAVDARACVSRVDADWPGRCGSA